MSRLTFDAELSLQGERHTKGKGFHNTSAFLNGSSHAFWYNIDRLRIHESWSYHEESVFVISSLPSFIIKEAVSGLNTTPRIRSVAIKISYIFSRGSQEN